ncbi:MAG: histidine kinase [Lachnospiraceae bacterium]|nr:histidine kinase [Lachnospiraceae bacterium]
MGEKRKTLGEKHGFIKFVLWGIAFFFLISIVVMHIRGMEYAGKKDIEKLDITGEYSIDGGKTYIAFDNARKIPSAGIEHITIRLKADKDIPKDKTIFFYSSNTDITAFLNGKNVFFMHAYGDNPWVEFESPGIKTGDEIILELKAITPHVFNPSFRVMLKKAFVGNKYDLLIYEMTINTFHILACIFCVILGIALFLTRFSIGTPSKYNTEGLTSCSMLLIFGGICCFLYYDFITLLIDNYIGVKYIDTLTQGLTFIFMTGYVRRYVYDKKLKQVSYGMTFFSVIVVILYSVNQMFVPFSIQDSNLVFSWVVAIGIAVSVAQVLFLFSGIRKAESGGNMVFLSLLLCAAGTTVEMTYHVLTGIYIGKVFLITFFIFAWIQYRLITKYFYDTGREAEKAQKLEKELTENHVKMMLSQIQPHFLYNALGTIRSLCTKDPAEARNALDHFAKYLRANMDSLNEKWCIPFSKELEHVNSYLYIEKLRFGDLLKIEYDIRAERFELPPLTLQTIVENAVKHGLLAKREGGTVKISTKETRNNIEITVQDTGVGFDAAKKIDDGRSHVGIANTRQRIMAMCGGSLNIGSKIDEGTVITILLPKENVMIDR